MDLKEFVAETLVQIVLGAGDAQKQVDAAGVRARINPQLVWSGSTSTQGVQNAMGGTATIVKFDVALTTTSGTGTKGGIGVIAGPLSLGSTGQSHQADSTVSRVQFAVPVMLSN